MSMLRFHASRLQLAGLIAIAALVAGCSGDSTSDLRAYMDEIKTKHKGRIEPLPEFVPPPSFVYAATQQPDPFMTWSTRMTMMMQEPERMQQAFAGTGPHPDFRRRREPLEAFPLDTLRMVGILQRGAVRSALVLAPDGVVSRVVVGNYLGQNHGKITAIDERKVEVLEIVPDGLGGWLQRPASIALSE